MSSLIFQPIFIISKFSQGYYLEAFQSIIVDVFFKDAFNILLLQLSVTMMS